MNLVLSVLYGHFTSWGCLYLFVCLSWVSCRCWGKAGWTEVEGRWKAVGADSSALSHVSVMSGSSLQIWRDAERYVAGRCAGVWGPGLSVVTLALCTHFAGLVPLAHLALTPQTSRQHPMFLKWILSLFSWPLHVYLC